MKKLIVAGTVASAVLAFAGSSASADKPDCNWGRTTSAAIADGFDQGGHSSSFAGSKRAGLANVVNKGDLNALCNFIEDQL
jgi:hypothetical protein